MCDVTVWRHVRLMLVSFLLAAPVTASAGPKSFDTAGPRRWQHTSPIRVAWGGEAPTALAGENLDLDQIVTQAFSAWAAVPTTGLTFKVRSNAGNPRSPEALGKLTKTEGIDILIIFSTFFDRIVPPQPPPPPEWRENNVSLAGLTWEPDPPRFDLGYTIIVIDNTKIRTSEQLLGVIVHEAGHALGLEHSALNWPGLSLPNPRPDLPIMTPVDSRLPLREDDRASVAGLYEGRTFERRFGWIVGRVLDDSGHPVNGVMVTAVRVKMISPTTTELSTDDIYSDITPYGMTESTDDAGLFRIAVRRGFKYKISVATIRPGFRLSRGVERETRPLSGEMTTKYPVQAGKDYVAGRITAKLPAGQ